MPWYLLGLHLEERSTWLHSSCLDPWERCYPELPASQSNLPGVETKGKKASLKICNATRWSSVCH